MRVLVTGGVGFIGGHVVTELLSAGHAVRVVDVLLPAAHGPDAAWPSLPVGVELVRADLRDPVSTAAAVRGIDRICHQAAMVGLGVDLDDLPDYVANNDLATAVLLRAAAGRVDRVVLASSMVVYGEGAYTCTDHGAARPRPRQQNDLAQGQFEPTCPQCARPLTSGVIDETAALDPRNGYAATKVAQEHLCAVWARETGSSVVALRYHNVYGPRMPRDTPYAGVASIFRSALERGEAPQVFEDGGQRRDFTHVRDVARANLAALTTDAVPSGELVAYNVASGRPRTVGELAAALSDRVDGPQPVITGQYRLGDVRHVVASPDRAARELGFTATESFEAGIAEFARAPLRG